MKSKGRGAPKGNTNRKGKFLAVHVKTYNLNVRFHTSPDYDSTGDDIKEFCTIHGLTQAEYLRRSLKYADLFLEEKTP